MRSAAPTPRTATKPLSALAVQPPCPRAAWPDVVALCGIALFCLVRLALLANRGFDKDEFQSLHGGWCVAQGLLPFRDFWENHCPLVYYLLAPFFSWQGDGPLPLFLARGLMFVLCSLCLFLTWRIGRALFGRRVALFGVFLLAALDVFNQKMIEVRPDVPFVACWLASFWVWLHSKDRPGRQWLSGVLLGVGYGFTPKALFCLTAMACGTAVEARRRGVRGVFAPWVRYAAGFLIPVAGIWSAYAVAGAFRDLWQWTIAFNFTVPGAVRFWPGAVFSNWRDVAFWALTAWGFLDAVRSATGDEGASRLFVVSLVLLLIYIFPMPQPYAQTFAAVLPFFALLAARPLARLAERACDLRYDRSLRLRPALALSAVAVCVIALPLVPPWDDTSPTLRRSAEQKAQLGLRARLLAMTRPGEAVFDGESVCITRPQAYFFGSMIRILRCLHQSGEYPPPGVPDLLTSLDRCHCRVMHMDSALREALDERTEAKLEARFEPADAAPSVEEDCLPDGIYVARGMRSSDASSHPPAAH